jgi:putative ABC transport system permease protein
MPITAFQRTFNYGKAIGWFSVKSVDGYPISELQERIKAKLKIRKSIHPADQRAFGSWNMEEELADVNTLFASLKFISFSVGILALFAGIIGIGNIMLVSVTERTKEIGIRRALGAAPSVIIKQIISETLLITIVAGLLGIFFGVLVVELLNNALAGMGDSGSFRNPTVSFNVVFSSFLILIVAGVFTGLLPAYSAVRVKPIDALRKE